MKEFYLLAKEQILEQFGVTLQGHSKERAEQILQDKEQLILVYCRSGRRSKLAAEALVKLGYTNIREFGGIIHWPYEITG